MYNHDKKNYCNKLELHQAASWQLKLGKMLSVHISITVEWSVLPNTYFFKKKRKKKKVHIVNTSLVLFSFLLFFLAHLFYSFFFHFSQAHVWIFTRPTAIRNYTHCCKFYSERDKYIVVNCFYHLKKQNYIPKIIPKIAISYIYIYYIYILYMYIYVCLYIYMYIFM